MERIITKRDNGRLRVVMRTKGPSKTEQSHKKKCDINTIVAKIRKGQAVPIRLGSPMYGDFSQVTDYMSTINRVSELHEDFMAIPADIRKRFHNSPAEFMEFIQDDSNREEAIELGLVAKQGQVEQKTAQAAPVEPENTSEGSIEGK